MMITSIRGEIIVNSMYKEEKLGKYIKQIRGISYKIDDIAEEEEEEEGYKIVLRANSIQGYKLILKDLVYVKEGLVKPEQFIKKGDILIAASSGSKEVVGKSVQINEDTDLTFGAFCKLIRCKHNIHPKYVGYFFRTQYYRTTISNVVCGANINNLKNEHIDDLLIPVPSICLQQKIANVLDQAQFLIDKRKAQIEALDELIKSRFIEMFGDPIKNPLGWELKPFLESGSCKNGMNFGADETGIELQYLGVGDFKDLSKIDDVSSLGKVSLNQMPSKEYILQDGDIVFVRSNGNKALVGRCLAVYPKEILTTYSGFCIRYRKTDEKIEIPYLLQVLKTDSMRKNMAGRGANIQNLNQQILGQLMIPIPPLELQKQFSDFVKQVDKMKLKMENSLKELEDNFNSLMQKAFKGELF